MTEHEASRTLVKSPPELWAECSSAEALARHLNGSFGEIRITRLEPETAVAWEGELVSGTVRLEPSGWGTKVVLTAQAAGEAPEMPAGEAPGTGAVEVPQTPAVEAPETGAVEVQANPELEPASMAAEQAAIEPEPVE